MDERNIAERIEGCRRQKEKTIVEREMLAVDLWIADCDFDCSTYMLSSGVICSRRKIRDFDFD